MSTVRWSAESKPEGQNSFRSSCWPLPPTNSVERMRDADQCDAKISFESPTRHHTVS
jgi:hypothetical protein